MGSPPPPPLNKSNSSFIMRFCWNLKHTIFICLPIIMEIKIYKWGSSCLPTPKKKIFYQDCELTYLQLHLLRIIGLHLLDIPDGRSVLHGHAGDGGHNLVQMHGLLGSVEGNLFYPHNLLTSYQCISFRNIELCSLRERETDRIYLALYN